MANYYNIPINFKKLVSKERLELVELKSSIENHIMGMLMTGYNSYRYDPAYGCNIKEYDFELITSVNAWRHLLERNLQDAISQYETRVKNVRVRINIEDSIQNNKNDELRVSLRKKLLIDISCVIKATNNSHKFPEISVFISPLSFM